MTTKQTPLTAEQIADGNEDAMRDLAIEFSQLRHPARKESHADAR